MSDYENAGISYELQEELNRAAEEGNRLSDEGRPKEAVRTWLNAYEKIPDPKNIYPQSWWFEASIGDLLFLVGAYAEAYPFFHKAMNNISGEGRTNPFVLLRYGQCLYELQGLERDILNSFISAYMLEGEEIFSEEDPKYFQFLASKIDLSQGQP